MDDFARYKSCYRILRDNNIDQDDAYAIADAIWDVFNPLQDNPLRDEANLPYEKCPGIICSRCGAMLFTSGIPEYDYYCDSCDEDFYEFEVNKTNI